MREFLRQYRYRAMCVVLIVIALALLNGPRNWPVRFLYGVYGQNVACRMTEDTVKGALRTLYDRTKPGSRVVPHSTEDACRLLRGFANGLVDPMYKDANGACAFLKPDGCPNGQLPWSHVAFPPPGMAVSASKGVLYNRTERLPLRVDGEADGTGVVLDSQTVAIAGKRYSIQDDESAGACVAQQQDERCSVWRASGALVEALRQPDHGAPCSVVPPSGYTCESMGMRTDTTGALVWWGTVLAVVACIAWGGTKALNEYLGKSEPVRVTIEGILQ